MKCPKCSEALVERDGPYGRFYGCSAFPRCKGSVSITGRTVDGEYGQRSRKLQALSHVSSQAHISELRRSAPSRNPFDHTSSLYRERAHLSDERRLELAHGDLGTLDDSMALFLELANRYR